MHYGLYLQGSGLVWAGRWQGCSGAVSYTHLTLPLWCITIIGIPWGVQSFKFAKLLFCPFGKDVRFGGGLGSLILNIIWLCVSGLPLCVEAVLIGCILCITIVGIPFGKQCFKYAKLALMPFGADIVKT